MPDRAVCASSRACPTVIPLQSRTVRSARTNEPAASSWRSHDPEEQLERPLHGSGPDGYEMRLEGKELPAVLLEEGEVLVCEPVRVAPRRLRVFGDLESLGAGHIADLLELCYQAPAETSLDDL